jgi:hypothetical protein
MNLQRLIDQHPFAFVAIFPIYFLCLWLLVGTTISVIGGWFSLAKVYRTQVAFDGTKWRMQSAQMRWLANYNGCFPCFGQAEDNVPPIREHPDPEFVLDFIHYASNSPTQIQAQHVI